MGPASRGAPERALALATVVLAPLLGGAAPVVAQDAGGAEEVAVEGLAVEPRSPGAGDVVAVTAEVANTGDAELERVEVRFLLDGEPYHDATVRDLEAGATARVEAPGWTAERGEHAWEVRADPDDDLDEADEGDNRRRVEVRVGAARARPDLALDRLELLPGSPERGEAAHVVVNVRNLGDAPSGPTRLAFALDGAPLGTFDVPSLEAGELWRRGAAWTPTRTSHELRAVVDPGGAVAEADETNNARETDVRTDGAGDGDDGEVSATASRDSDGRPDLEVAALRVEPDPPVAGEPARVVATVRNDGGGDAKASVLAVRAGGREVGRADVPPLTAGGTADVALDWTPKAGPQVVQAKADVRRRVGEGDERNNVRTLAVLVAAVAPRDVRIAELGPEPAAPTSGAEVPFVAVVEARGAPGTHYQVRFDLDGQFWDLQELAPAGALTTVRSKPWPADPGTHEVRASVIAIGVVEADVANNARATSFEVARAGAEGTQAAAVGPADLAVRAVGPAPGAVPDAAGRVPVVVRVENLGPGDAGRFTVEAHVDGQSLGTIGVERLAAGQTEEVTWVSWVAVPGPHAFEAVVAGLDEPRTDNNRLRASAEVGGGLPGAEPLALPKLTPGPGLAGLAAVAVAAALAARRLRRRS